MKLLSRLVPGLTAASLLGTPAPSRAFPPAPFATIFGDVRDSQGNLLPANSATLVVSQNGREILRQPLSSPPGSRFNYQARLRIDMFRNGSAAYSSTALKTGTAYTIALSIGGQIFQPIEVSTTPPAVGAPADRRRLNLTLGIDSDNDGLPDAWEEAQLFHAGITPAPEGWDLSLISRLGDFDGDGLSNWMEYLAGTYATDAASHVRLEISSAADGHARFRFYALYGRTYGLESSTDNGTWIPVRFTGGTPAAPAGASTTTLTATASGPTEIFTAATTAHRFYRLTIR